MNSWLEREAVFMGSVWLSGIGCCACDRNVAMSCCQQSDLSIGPLAPNYSRDWLTLLSEKCICHFGLKCLLNVMRFMKVCLPHHRAYDPADYDHLPVSAEIKELFQYITRWVKSHNPESSQAVWEETRMKIVQGVVFYFLCRMMFCWGGFLNFWNTANSHLQGCEFEVSSNAFVFSQFFLRIIRAWWEK